MWAVRKVLTIDIPFTRLGSLRHFHRLQQLYLPTRTDCRTLSGYGITTIYGHLMIIFMNNFPYRLEKLTNLTNLVIPFALHVDTLQWPRSLQYVSVEGSDITDKGVNALLTSSPNIESLVLQNCKFAVPNCLPALSQTRCLRKLLIPCEDPAIIGQIVSSTAVEHLYTTCPAGKVVQLFSSTPTHSIFSSQQEISLFHTCKLRASTAQRIYANNNSSKSCCGCLLRISCHRPLFDSFITGH